MTRPRSHDGSGAVPTLGECVLIADDQPDIRLLLRLSIERAGYRVVEASSGDDALALARRERPEVAVLDHDMPPGMSGLDVAAAMARDPATAGVRTIITSITVCPDDRGASQRQGVHAYLPKPFSVTELIACVARLMATPH